MTLNRYLLFAGDTYYPLGGVLDLACSYCDFDEAVLDMGRRDDQWQQLFDSRAGRVVAAKDKGGLGNWSAEKLIASELPVPDFLDLDKGFGNETEGA